MSTLTHWLAQYSEHGVLFYSALFFMKITLLLSLSWCVHFLFRKANPRWRVLLWRSGMVLKRISV